MRRTRTGSKLARETRLGSKTTPSSSKAKKSLKRQIKPSRSKLIKEADRLASLYVRQSYANTDGLVGCFTCNGVYPWKKIQNGHYVPRGHKYTRWELDNMRPQCFLCNCRMYGQAFIFRENLVEELGEKRVKEVETAGKLLFKEKDDYITERIDFFTRGLATLNANN